MIEWKWGKTENIVALWRSWWSINDKRHKWQNSGPEALWQVFIVKTEKDELHRVTVLLYVLQTYIQYPKWLNISANKSKWGFGSLSLSPEKKDYICFLIATGCGLFIFFLSLSSSTSYRKTLFQHPGLTWVRPNCPVRTDSNKIDHQRFLCLLGWPSPRFTTQTPKITYNLPHKIPTYQGDDRKGSE